MYVPTKNPICAPHAARSPWSINAHAPGHSLHPSTATHTDVRVRSFIVGAGMAFDHDASREWRKAARDAGRRGAAAKRAHAS